jgi:Cof subfamily protein (haloacid dehalogenase superfamily)
MAYKLLAIDLDETLLTTDKHISSGNAEALRRAMDAGKYVVLASGRTYISIVNCLSPFMTDNYIISSSGAQVHDKDGKLVYDMFVDPARVKDVINWCRDRGIHSQTYSDEGFHYVKEGPYSKYYEEHNHMKGFEDPLLYERDDIRTSKMLIIDSLENVGSIKEQVREAFPDLVIVNSQSQYIEVLAPAVSKAAALEWVAGKLGVAREEIIAFGDNEVDLSMLEYAGFAVGMSNGEPAVLDIADYITQSNNDDGVAKAIYKFVLNEKPDTP